jgi:hypothetical protein
MPVLSAKTWVLLGLLDDHSGTPPIELGARNEDIFTPSIPPRVVMAPIRSNSVDKVELRHSVNPSLLLPY